MQKVENRHTAHVSPDKWQKRVIQLSIINYQLSDSFVNCSLLIVN